MGMIDDRDLAINHPVPSPKEISLSGLLGERWKISGVWLSSGEEFDWSVSAPHEDLAVNLAYLAFDPLRADLEIRHVERG